MLTSMRRPMPNSATCLTSTEAQLQHLYGPLSRVVKRLPLPLLHLLQRFASTCPGRLWIRLYVTKIPITSQAASARGDMAAKPMTLSGRSDGKQHALKLCYYGFFGPPSSFILSYVPLRGCCPLFQTPPASARRAERRR